ncbi:hypothetical protein [Arthrobacter sp. H5]|uniref:hypothetical protein n=1 Tax=Arthrobacter sp. H5 TaxID=1267973 RepID=UPI0004823B0B|nr:hypothetical protein [Arthrobacter sp. H5]
MPWWFWIVLWVVLVLVSALFLGFLGFRIFRQVMAVLRDVEGASQLFALSERTPDTGANPDQPSAAVFLDPADVRSQNRLKAALRARARSQRRIRRRTHRGQPQLLRDMPHL